MFSIIESMFSGLVEEMSPVLGLKGDGSLIELTLKRPRSFKSLKRGESICGDGVCLTLEKFDKNKMSFSLAPETLKITGWNLKNLKNKVFNLERSITLQSAIGGHLVSGHVDGKALVKKIQKKGGSRILQIEIPKEFQDFFWKKGFVALNGVSLTINQSQARTLELCLIPETLKLTNLSFLKSGDSLNFEVDYMSRSLVYGLRNFLNKS